MLAAPGDRRRRRRFGSRSAVVGRGAALQARFVGGRDPIASQRDRRKAPISGTAACFLMHAGGLGCEERVAGTGRRHQNRGSSSQPMPATLTPSAAAIASSAGIVISFVIVPLCFSEWLGATTEPTP
jgi:hypothetical protein